MRALDIDHNRLVALFRRIALVTAPLASLTLASCRCGEPDDEIFLIRNPDAETQALVDACRAPTPDCTPLCRKLAGPSYDIVHCELHDDREGYVQVHVGTAALCGGGRRPQALALTGPAPSTSDAGCYFATLYQLEAASVPAFMTLGRELAEFGAPPALRRAAVSAARDEVRHARLAAALARRHGAEPVDAVVGPPRPRNLAAMADENVVEGCVGEAYGAQLAAVQARAAGDPLVRAAMGVIAADEARHAALAFAVQRWAASRLDSRARARLAAARRDATAALETRAGEGWTPALGATVGLPGPAASRTLLRALEGALWS